MATCPSKLTKYNLCLLYHALAQLSNAIICKKVDILKLRKKNKKTRALLHYYTRWFKTERPFLGEEGSMGPLLSFYCSWLLRCFLWYNNIHSHQCEKVYNPHHRLYLLFCEPAALISKQVLPELARIPGRIDKPIRKVAAQKTADHINCFYFEMYAI